jgi:glycosyltransferase involved in cell wall biosynthesis
VHTHTPRTIIQAARALAGLPAVTHVATKHLLNAPQDRRWGLAFALLDRFSLYLPHRLMPVSQTMERQIIALPGLRQRTTMVRNAIPCDEFYAPQERDACRAELGLPLDAPVIGYTGRVQQVKRLDLLLHAFVTIRQRYPQARLLIAGDGDERPELEELAEQLDIEQAVIWTGFRQDIPRLLAAMDIYILPSINEGLPLSVLEAMAAGKPVIATTVGGTAEAVTQEQTGMLIPPGSVGAISTALLDLLDHPEKQRRLAESARTFVTDAFGLTRMVESYRHIYKTTDQRY